MNSKVAHVTASASHTVRSLILQLVCCPGLPQFCTLSPITRAQAIGFMPMGAFLKRFVIDGVENRPSKVVGLLLTLGINGSAIEVGAKRVSTH